MVYAGFCPVSILCAIAVGVRPRRTGTSERGPACGPWPAGPQSNRREPTLAGPPVPHVPRTSEDHLQASRTAREHAHPVLARSVAAVLKRRGAWHGVGDSALVHLPPGPPTVTVMASPASTANRRDEAMDVCAA